MLILLTLLGCAHTGPLPSGTWGGDGYTLDVPEDGAPVLRGACGQGVVEGPLVADAQSAVVAELTWTTPSGAEEPGRIDASARGRKLTGHLVVGSFPEMIDDIELKRGREGTLGACEGENIPPG
ncbi:MAG: hypothetical protein H6739_11280 [Alphaproteobacteria bacterium]|nr:hypothetical protein [Alphaproteobacteria bacterium]